MPSAPPIHRSIAIAVLAVAALFAPDATAYEVAGTYSSPVGKLKVAEKDGIVTGRFAGGTTPCGFKRGAVVLEGTRLDDSVTGSFKACKVGDGCGGDVDGMVMLLLTRKGKVMSGAVHMQTGQCKTPLKGDAITLRMRGKKKSASVKRSPKKRPPKKSKGAPAAGKQPKKGPKAGAEPAPKGGERGGDSGSSRAPESSDEGDDASGTASPGGEEGDDPEAAPTAPGDRGSAVDKMISADPLMKRGKAEEARRLFQEAIDIDPSYSQAYLAVGVTYYMRDRYDEALEFYKQALEKDPGNKDAYYNIACIYALQGDKAQALRYLRIAFLNGYIDLHTLSDDPDLKSLHGDKDFENLKQGIF